MTITEFLAARLDEAAASAAGVHLEDCNMVARFATDRECDCAGAAFVLADIAAKRRIIEVAAEIDRKIDAEWGGVREANELWADGGGYEGREVLKLLTQPYAGHPDYREDWRP